MSIHSRKRASRKKSHDVPFSYRNFKGQCRLNFAICSLWLLLSVKNATAIFQ